MLNYIILEPQLLQYLSKLVGTKKLLQIELGQLQLNNLFQEQALNWLKFVIDSNLKFKINYLDLSLEKLTIFPLEAKNIRKLITLNIQKLVKIKNLQLIKNIAIDDQSILQLVLNNPNDKLKINMLTTFVDLDKFNQQEKNFILKKINNFGIATLVLRNNIPYDPSDEQVDHENAVRDIIDKWLNFSAKIASLKNITIKNINEEYVEAGFDYDIKLTSPLRLNSLILDGAMFTDLDHQEINKNILKLVKQTSATQIYLTNLYATHESVADAMCTCKPIDKLKQFVEEFSQIILNTVVKFHIDNLFNQQDVIAKFQFSLNYGQVKYLYESIHENNGIEIKNNEDINSFYIGITNHVNKLSRDYYHEAKQQQIKAKKPLSLKMFDDLVGIKHTNNFANVIFKFNDNGNLSNDQQEKIYSILGKRGIDLLFNQPNENSNKKIKLITPDNINQNNQTKQL